MTEERTQRRLAAILAADVVGYSRLMGEDESRTLTALNAHRAEFIHPTTSQYGGRIVKLMGDGALVEFPSVVDAVECAVAVQQGMAERNADVPEDKRITFRIGVNVGDIIIDGDDIYGDGVNVDDAAEQFDKLYAALPPEALEVVLERLPYRDEKPRRRIRDALAQAGLHPE